MSEQDVRAALIEQADYCDRSAAPLTAAVLRAVEAALDRSTATGRRTLDWAGDPRGSADSVALRLAGGFHALARRGSHPGLTRVYGGALDEAPEAVRDALHRHDADLVGWLDSPPQTNETGRAAAIMAGLLVLAQDYGLPFELIELGASAGLNLNLDRFGYRLGERMAGDPASPVQLAPRWTGTPPPDAQVQVVGRRGVDQAPVRVADPAERERLACYCWPDQPERMQRLEAALSIAAAYPPPVEQGDAADFAERVLQKPQAEGVCRVVYQTIFWSYLPADKQARIREALAAAGARATADRPLAWLRYELGGPTAFAELHLQQWPGGAERHLATGHAHGTALDWR